MINERDLDGRTPAQERAEIGTPAGESPEEGRKRHGTTKVHPEIEPGEIERRKTLPDDAAEVNDEDYAGGGTEIGTTGGITGTHVTGGIPAGGRQSGGTPGEPREQRSADYKS